MGIFDTYGRTQLKVGDVGMAEYKIGDSVEIPDGVYLGWDGVVVIIGGQFIAEFESLIDTHERHWTARDTLHSLWGLARNSAG